MEENTTNNNLTEEKNIKFTYSKLFSWIALFLATSSPVMGIGFAVLSISLLTEDDKEETKVINYISIALALVLVLFDIIIRFI